MPRRVPRGWVPAFHPQGGGRGGNQLAWRPGLYGTGMQARPPVPVSRYVGRVSQVPLTGGRAQGTVSGGGAVTLSVGPQGLGTVWYPVQVTLSTTTGVLDSATALVFIGSQGIPITQVGQQFTGNGTVALAIPPMTPGEALIVKWTGGHSGDTAAMNVLGTMDALSTS